MESIIRPSADLRNKYNELSRLTKESQSPIAITVNGKEDTILINHALYHRQVAELELLRDIAEAQNDFENGRSAPIDGMFDELREELKNRYEL